MANLPTNRTTANTPTEHVDDHNTLHTFHNLIDAKGDLIVGTAADTAGKKAVGTDGQVLTADSTQAGGIKWATPSGSSVVHDHFTRTAGNLTLNTTTWANLPTIGTTWDITLAAAAGDTVECSLSAVCDSAAVNTFFDVVTIVSGSVTNSISTGATPSDSNDGVSAWFMASSAAQRVGGSIMYTLQAGDVSGGNVILRLRYREDGATNRNLHATALFPLQFTAKKLGAAV